jgi:ElaB/YqjD/DUF883 family membrane-anchored ribosome-binding protein
MAYPTGTPGTLGETRTPGGPTTGGMTGREPETTGSLTDKAKEIASTVVDRTRDAAATVADKVQDVASGVAQRTSEVAGAIGHKAEDAVTSVADTWQSSQRYVREKGVGGMVEDLGDVIRKHPFPALCMGFALGLLLARVTRD